MELNAQVCAFLFSKAHARMLVELGATRKTWWDLRTFAENKKQTAKGEIKAICGPKAYPLV